MQVVDDKMNKTIKYVLIRIFNFNFFTNDYDGFANPKNVSEKNKRFAPFYVINLTTSHKPGENNVESNRNHCYHNCHYALKLLKNTCKILIITKLQ